MSHVCSSRNTHSQSEEQSSQYFHSLVQALPKTRVVLFDSELNVILVDGSGFSKEEIVGENYLGLSLEDFMTLLLGEDSTEKVTLHGDVFGGKANSYEQTAGEARFSVKLVPLYNDDHEIYAGMAIIQDITQRVRVAEKLTNLADQLKMLNELGQAVVSNLNNQEIYNPVLTKIRQMVEAQGVFIFLAKHGQLLIEAQDMENSVDLVGKGMPSSDGICGELLGDQQSLLISGEECLERLFEPLAGTLGYTPRSFMSVPITWGERKFGVIVAIHIEEGKFTQEDLNLTENAAAWTAIALNNASQRKQLERRLAEANTTSQLLEEILSANLSLKLVLQHVVEAGKNIVPTVDWAAIHLFDERSHHLLLEAVTGVIVSVEEYLLEYGQGIAGRVLESGQLINVADVSQDERVISFPRTSQAHSLLVAPIKDHEGETIGTISLQSSKVGQFSGEDENLLLLLAHQAGLAIENARLYETAEYRRRVAQIQRERLRQVTHRMVNAQEEERERIARELHDEAGQSLTAMKISLDLLGNSLPGGMDETRQAIMEASKQTELIMENMRSLAHNLRPPALDRLGLNLALEGLCQQFESMTNIHTIYQGTKLPRLPSSHEITLYRFVQEALANIAKHANASEVQVQLDSQTGQIEIHVQDNGKGIQDNPLDDDRELEKGMGLASMEERLNFIGGKLEVRSAPGSGTQLQASIPLRLREQPT
jgi:signal transduction histidine kinase